VEGGIAELLESSLQRHRAGAAETNAKQLHIGGSSSP
jgi:hypothetical protein